VAIIGLIGVLISAAFSVLTGVVTARLAGSSAANVTAQQLAGETDKSRAEFLRGQRQILYSKIVADENEIFNAEWKTENTLITDGPRKAGQQLDVARDLEVKSWETYQAQVEILASGDFKSCFARLHLIHENERLQLITLLSIRQIAAKRKRSWVHSLGRD
jgi:hypothetical protein